ncbi:hypothetical protein CI109_104334 [Kwoniella shandongensis]|uniref:Ornithine decarboxylase antizyme n=1 Tax=Kwoniella shandongensis TaxID=1734106 RepID=A0A5M6BXK3_9TREE|nr:uncharacterized protein CI109_004270 [Kwoniella shandongensis]KAA5527453.1 hypothetical protein CI109_004270 [Kwoniella shandongensis]
MNSTSNIQINRNLRPAGASGSAGTGASPTYSLLFSPNHHHDLDHPFYPPLAIARAGGKGGQIFVYSDVDEEETSAYASFAGGGRRWDAETHFNVDQSSENTRDPLTSYLHHQFSQFSPSSQSIFTPPSSFTQSVDIPHTASSRPHQVIASSNLQPMSLPLTPMSSSSLPTASTSTPITIPSSRFGPRSGRNATVSPDGPIVSLISSIFPHHASIIASFSHTLEILTPPSHLLKGFILDHPSSGRTVYIHLTLSQPNPTQPQRPETLSPNFSQVLRPHDPQLLTSPPPSVPSTIGTTSRNGRAGATNTNYALDVRESLTALLDLASEALEASHLVLVLDRQEREGQEGILGELLHSLMYVGGQVVKPGALEGGWEWDPTKWVLVGMEL